ncbi:MAG: MarR family winged helix-turn-helix transcriptional regulator [Methanospirillum sp.]
MTELDGRDLVLACLAAAGESSYEPVQIQKTLFLFQNRGLGQEIFQFVPYDYGPFDPTVYRTLEDLATDGLVEIRDSPFDRYRTYRLSPEGRVAGQATLEKLPEAKRDFLVRLSQWVRKRSFSELVGAIYKAYPEMKVNSVFRG